MTEVVAALIFRENRFMICQRPPHKGSGLLWEFVGGKVETGETGRDALVRECREELGITVSVGGVFAETVYEYPDVTVHLTVYRAGIVSGEPELLEHVDLKWILPEEVDLYDFCPADRHLLPLLRSL